MNDGGTETTSYMTREKFWISQVEDKWDKYMFQEGFNCKNL